MRFAAPNAVLLLTLLLVSSGKPGTTLGQTVKASEIWLEIPEMQSRVEANSVRLLDVLPRSGISHMRIHIDKQPIDASYGDIHTKINTEAAADITSKRSVAEGILCELDLTHWQRIQARPGAQLRRGLICRPLSEGALRIVLAAIWRTECDDDQTAFGAH